jgi:hypothetical protein
MNMLPPYSKLQSISTLEMHAAVLNTISALKMEVDLRNVGTHQQVQMALLSRPTMES